MVGKAHNRTSGSAQALSDIIGTDEDPGLRIDDKIT
jgi:hypothetical protein